VGPVGDTFWSLTEFLEESRAAHGFDPIAVVDLNGEVLARAGKDDPFEVWPDPAGVVAAAAAAKQGVHISISPNDPTKLNLYHIIAGSDGAPAAALAVSVRPTDVFEPLRRVTEGLGNTGEVVLVNRDGRILTPLRFPLPDGTRPTPLEYEIKAVPAASAARGQEGVVESLDYRGVPVVAAYRYLPLSENSGWGMVVKRDSREVFGPVRQEVGHSLLLGLVALVPLVALVLIASRNLTRPLAALSGAARRVAGGDLSARAPVGSTDEVGILAATFNSMVARVQERTSDLREANEQLRREVAERKRAEHELTDSRNRLLAVIEGTTDIVFLKDADGRYMLGNSAAARAVGLAPRDLLGRTDFEFWPRATAERLRAADRRVMASGQPEMLEETMGTEGGETRTYSMLKAPFVDQEGATIGVLGVGRDITEQRHLEAEVVRARHLDALGTLAGGIAHDFNNYLTGLRGAIGLARTRIDAGDETYEILANAEKEALRASGLAEQLLTFARGGAPVRKMASLAELIADTATFALSGSNVKGSISIPSDLWSAEVDEGQISQVLTNVIRNADEAMPTGGTVSIAAENVIVRERDPVPLEPGRYVKVSIADDGPGMSDKALSKAFDPYFTTKENGSGLGLAVANSIVVKHGGHIAIESRPGVGTTVAVHVPASRMPGPADPQSGAGPQMAKGKVLFVDDESLIVLTQTAILKDLGYEVESARNGQEAIARYREARQSGRPFDVVVMDLTLPGRVSGKDAARALLQMDPEARVIASSGYSNDPVMASHAEYGFKGVAPKPYSTEELTGVLQSVVRGDSQREAPA
jgi:PAS domain S-box-containing protein